MPKMIKISDEVSYALDEYRGTMPRGKAIKTLLETHEPDLETVFRRAIPKEVKKRYSF
ncbi:MAG: hypothetical protein OXC62_11465 [Aestuariivita sp.]|nr:hypothetical protein [Aestuariivita sp.]